MQAICMVGAFPPPTHGMAAVNLAMRDCLIASGGNPIVFDVSARSLSRAWYVRLFRVAVALNQLRKYASLLLRRRNISVYLSVSGGYGQLYDIAFVLFGRLAGARIFLHHHNFRYLTEQRVLARQLMALAGRASRHIVLCNVMAERLRAYYPSAGQIIVLSNSAWLPASTGLPRLRDKVATLGFLGNIEMDKGILEFLGVLQRVQEEGSDVQGVIAGPFHNKATEKLVRDKLSGVRNVRYVGPKYGAEKAEFFDSIDVLLYPTRNDAEPLTVLEAMGRGIPVVAWSRGCIAQMIPSSSGMVIESDKDYVSNAANQIRIWQESPHELRNRSQDIMERFSTMQREAKKSLKNLCSQLALVQ